MATTEEQELVDQFQGFFRTYYHDEIGELAQRYPSEQRSLHVDWGDLYTFDQTLANEYLNQPEQYQKYAEEALRLYDLPVDVNLGQAHIRVYGLDKSTEIRDIRERHINTLVSVQGIIRKATSVRPKIQSAAFECQRCGTLTRIPQTGGGFQEPHECQGCERQGPFQVNFDQSEFVDSQKLRIQESPEGLKGGQTPESIDVNIEDDLTGAVTPGDRVTVTGTLKVEQQSSGGEKSPVFDVYMDGISVEIEDEEFDEMDITEEDKKEIIELSNEPDIYEQMVDSIAPTIYGYRQEKLAIILQLFSGVTKHLPDGSRTRGDLHMLLIGDPGTGKCLNGDELVTLADGRERPIRELVEANLDEPKPVDDGVYDEVDLSLPSLDENGSITHRRATRVWKREAPEQMYRIRTESGHELEVTPSHPLFVQSEGRFAPKQAEDLEPGAFIATPRRIPTNADDALDVDFRRARSNNAVRLDLPDEWTPSLARLIGYIIAEGYAVLDDDHLGDVRVTNNDREVLDDIARALDELGLNYTESKTRENKSARLIRCGSSEFASFLVELEPAILEASAEQRVPDELMSASDPIKKEFLRAYVDAECHVAAKEREITVASMSRELLEGVRSLLLSLGIRSQLHERRNGSYRLRISGDDFERYVRVVGFVTERKEAVAVTQDGVEGNTNVDVVPNVGEELHQIRRRLRLSQFDCGLPRSTYQHYERGDRNPSRESLATVVKAFEDRIEWLQDVKARLKSGDWDTINEVRRELRISQAELAEVTDVGQGSISLYERGEVVADGGVTADVRVTLRERVDDALDAVSSVERLRALVESDVSWDRIEAIEAVEPDDEWVYDLEVEGTHNYVSSNVISHNSALLQYVQHISPRSVYTSGKGSSAAGLCVTGDTIIHTEDGFVPIRKLAVDHHPKPVTEETAAEYEHGVYTFDRESGEVVPGTSSHVWRMPEKPCRKLETESGKELETSVNTPVLVCKNGGMEWCELSDIEPGDHVAVPKYASEIAFRSTSKTELLAQTDGGIAKFYNNFDRGDDPGRERALEILAECDLGEMASTFSDVAESDLVWEEVVAVGETGSKELFDLTVPGTHNFVANGVVTHNTAAAVRDEFGDGQQWSLEAGALVLADKGVAAVDEIDKMRSEDRSAMHEALEQQQISVSKAGINATLKSRCSLLAAANPKYGRFDQYESIGEQIDLEPPLISRFDLIFTVTDQPDREDDTELAEHIIQKNYVGELSTQHVQLAAANVSEEQVESASEEVEPAIDAELLRKYVAHARADVYPTMTEPAKEAIRDFYVDLRAKGEDEDAPVPVTARKLEALIRLAEASARVRLSDRVTREDADRVIEIVRSCLQDIGVDPETGQFDADVVETGTSKSQRERIKNVKGLIADIESDYEEGAPVEEVLERADEIGMDPSKAEHEIEKLKQQGEVYEPANDYLRTT